MKVFFIAYAFIAALGSLALFAVHKQASALAFSCGAFLMMLNVAALQFAWSRILSKKQVALPLGVIVIKYAILGFIIYRVATENLLDVPWFAAGFSVVLISAVAAQLRQT